LKPKVQIYTTPRNGTYTLLADVARNLLLKQRALENFVFIFYFFSSHLKH